MSPKRSFLLSCRDGEVGMGQMWRRPQHLPVSREGAGHVGSLLEWMKRENLGLNAAPKILDRTTSNLKTGCVASN